ncbi:hypothetical protein J1N35_025011 [Gossypium stocksii]|uniref:Reverse transcriptase n=1 Tax=Gossypium stocksii TaxID=47602 RepID=A0A9D3V6S5_9ROSI|nr:hypothetical protein J1N35_025011 [Gossypium stocksii]
MSNVLGCCIDEAQRAFIPGRLISNNVLIAYKVIHSLKMKKRGKKGNFALKLDMSKAYDRVEWDFLASMMTKLGFHANWIVLIMRCVCSISYSVNLNRSEGEWFLPSRDDCILFRNVTCEGACVVRDVIREYELVSGQRVNFDKSLIYFGTNVDSVIRENIINLLGVRGASSPEKYLGLPMMPKCDGGMGFKNMFLFNKALLAKQAWRILSQPKCLLAKVLKARYYPSSDLLLAKIGSYLSFTWRSIYNAWELLVEGLVWRVGSGDRINIWNDYWLPGKESNRISVQKILPNWSTVNQLIKPDSNTWDSELIHQLFDETTAKRILSIPISGATVDDMLVWKYEGSREYTVKSRYRALPTELLQNHTFICPNYVDYRGFYKSLWNLNILAKIKIHIWRLINDLLPHFCNLAQRSLIVDVVCPLCKVEREDSGHLLWSYDFLNGVALTSNSAHDLQLTVTAVIVRDSKDEIVGAETYLFSNVSDAFLVEARACERALLFTVEKGYRRVIIEGDSLTVIKSIHKKEEDKLIIQAITHHINLLNKNFDSVTYTFVPRLVNRTAHMLAIEGQRRQIFGAWAERVPVTVSDLARMDRQRL